MSELRKCPFCGGRVAMNQDDEGYYVSCCEEGCVVMTNSYAEKEAVEKWNNRTPTEEVVARLEEMFKYNSEQADVYMDGDDLYMREKKEMYMDRANCFGVAIRLVKEGMG